MTPQYIIDLYEAIYKQVSLNRDFKYKPNPTDNSCIENFLSFLRKNYQDSAGEQFIKQYFEWQFGYWHDKDTRMGTGVVMLNWVIGKKAIHRYLDRTSDYSAIKLKNVVGTKLDQTQFKSQKETFLKQQKEVYQELSEFEEAAKKELHNTEEGLLWCMQMTTLYNHKSELCLGCINNEKCKTVLQTQMRFISKIRGYG